MRRMRPNGPAEVMPVPSHGWWKGWRDPQPLTDEFRDCGRGFNVLSVIGYRSLDHKDRAFKQLERACESLEPALLFARVAPWFDRLRADARYVALLDKLGLGDPRTDPPV